MIKIKIKKRIRDRKCERQCRIDYYEKNKIARQEYRKKILENRKELRECIKDCNEEPTLNAKKK